MTCTQRRHVMPTGEKITPLRLTSQDKSRLEKLSALHGLNMSAFMREEINRQYLELSPEQKKEAGRAARERNAVRAKRAKQRAARKA